MFLSTEVEVPELKSLESVEAGEVLAFPPTDTELGNEELFSAGRKLSAGDLSRLKRGGVGLVPVVGRRQRWEWTESFEPDQQDSVRELDYQLPDFFLEELSQRQVAKTSRYLAHFYDLYRGSSEDGGISDFLEGLLEKALRVKEKIFNLKGRWGNESIATNQLVKQLKDGEWIEPGQLEGLPSEFQAEAAEIIGQRLELYNQICEMAIEYGSRVREVYSECEGENDCLKIKTLESREHLRERECREFPTCLLTAEEKNRASQLIEPPLFSHQDTEVGTLVSRSRQVVENLLFRDLFLEETVRNLVDFVNEKLFSDQNFYQRLTFPGNEGSYLLSHVINVFILAQFLARKSELNLTYEERLDLGTASLLYDLGMLKINPRIWRENKVPEEEVGDKGIERNPEYSLQFLERASYNFPDRVEEAVAQHHERLDGTGYPEGLSGSQIKPLARVLMVADVYDAMSTSRPYRKRIQTDSIFTYLRNRADKFDPRVLKAVKDYLGSYPPGTVVQLDTNEIGVTMKADEKTENILVKTVIDSRGQVYEDPEVRELEDVRIEVDHALGNQATLQAIKKAFG